MMSTWWALGVVSVIIGLVLGKNRYVPAAIVLMALGIGIMVVRGQFNLVKPPGMTLPGFTLFSPHEVWQTFLLAGFAQIPLTVTNAVIATAALIKSYWPEKPVSENRLSLNMGFMNLVLPFFGSMPLCHGAGGLAGQYYFGARTGGTNIIEGLIEISLGLFLAGSIAALLAVFPVAIIGAMMFLVGIELTKFAKDSLWNKDVVPMGTTVIISLLTNMACGFLGGFVMYYLMRIVFKRNDAKNGN
jgi:MFS superfamily sulfate permease-like transporter